jgi:hypothetical protein
VFSNETGIQKVKGPNLVDRRIVNANETKRGACRELSFAETEECMRIPRHRRLPAGFGVGSNQLKVLASCAGSFRSGHTRKKNPNRYPDARMNRHAVGQRACGFLSQAISLRLSVVRRPSSGKSKSILRC